MTRSEVLFRVIDVLFNPLQNYRRYKNIAIGEKEFVYNNDYPEDCTGQVYYKPELVGKDKPLLPVVINYHGGGFVKGDKHFRRSLCKRFASHDYFVVNINYRLSPKFCFPGALHDCILSMNYLSKLAETYNIDLNKVCVTGDSAGAHMATQIVAMNANPEMCKKINAPEIVIKPALLVSFCGPYDLVKSISMTKLPFNLVWDIGRCYLNDKTFNLKKDFSNVNDYPHLDCVSPINWVNDKWCPSFLVISGNDLFCKGQGELLKIKLDEVGVDNKAFASTKFMDNHCFHMNFWTKTSKDCFRQVFEFMDEHLK